ncbi:MAG: hypothetical protein IT436_04750 [Phycisphaerales bacterium]|nr:hypothetical protein [Phycisphaerales bacterium]
MNTTTGRGLVRWVGAGLVAVATVSGCSSAPETNRRPAAPTGSFAFWPSAPDEPRIQFIRSISSSEDVASTKTSGFEKIVFGEDAGKPSELNKPYGVAMRDGTIYVCDIRGSALVAFDLNKKQTRLIGTSGANRLDHPVGVTVAEDGMIYVADNSRSAIVVFDASERYMTTFGVAKSKPASLAVHGERLYVTDMASQVVQIFDRHSGAMLGTIGTVGDEDGQFRLPLGIATDPAGNIWVTDMMRCRVQKFAPDGQFVLGIGTLGDYAGSFARPKHIAVDKDGVVYVVDAAFQNVQMFDGEGRLLMAFGAAGDFPGAMNLPAGICIAEDAAGLFAGQIHPGFDPKRVVLVTNQFGLTKVSLYAMGTKREGWTVQQLAAAAVPVSTGVGVTSPERKKMQEQGGQPEPSAVPGATPPAAPAPTGPAATPKRDQPAPTPEPKQN